MKSTAKPPVTFNPRQIEYLQEIFPEVLGTPTDTPNQLYYNAGIRTVIHYIAGLSSER